MTSNRLLSVTLLLGSLIIVAHIAAIFTFLPKTYSQTPFWGVDLFFLLFTSVGLYLISNRKEKKASRFLKYYFIYTTIKVLSMLGFLSPWLINKTDLSKPMAYQFLALFAIFLFVETFLLVRLLNK